MKKSQLSSSHAVHYTSVDPKVQKDEAKFLLANGCNCFSLSSSGAPYKMWYMDRKVNNKDNIRVRYKFEDPDEKAKKTDMKKKPSKSLLFF